MSQKNHYSVQVKHTYSQGQDFVESFEAMKLVIIMPLKYGRKDTFWTNEGSARCFAVRGFAANLPRRLGSENIFPKPNASSAVAVA